MKKAKKGLKKPKNKKKDTGPDESKPPKDRPVKKKKRKNPNWTRKSFDSKDYGWVNERDGFTAYRLTEEVGHRQFNKTEIVVDKDGNVVSNDISRFWLRFLPKEKED